jgi:hypothetical protein
MFQAIALFFNFNNVGVLFTILAMIAVIYYGIRVTMFHQGSLLSTSKYFLAFFIILSVLVYNKTTVLVKDVSNPTAVTNAEPIKNVPWGVAQLWSGFTNIQYALATDFTTAFSTPAGDNLLNMGVGVSIVQQEDSAMISTSNSYLYQDYNEYISNCVAPGISAGYLNVSELLSAGNATDTASQTYGANEAGNIWTVMSTYTLGAGANMLTEWYSGTAAPSDTYLASGIAAPNGTSTTCANETTWLNSAIQNYYIPNNLGPSMAGELQFASFSELANALGQINPYIYNMQQTGQAQLMQAIGVNMYAPAILKMAQTSGASASSLAVATGTATSDTQASMLTSGILAGRYMPIVFGIFEALMLGASVIILILTITHMGVKYLKLLFEMLIMITIWPSLTAVFNYVSQLIIQAQYQPLSGLGYSVSGSGEISSFLVSSLAWMGYLSWSVPMMAYAIASGSSYAMTSMVGGLSSGVNTSGSKAISRGDFEGGNVSTDNMNSNKFDVTHTQNTGVAPKVFQNGFSKASSANGITDVQNDIPGISSAAQIQGTGDGTKNNQKLNTSQGFVNGTLTSFQAPNLRANMSKSVTAGYSQNLLNAKSKAETAATNYNSAVSKTSNLSNSVGSNLSGTKKEHYDTVATTSYDNIVDHQAGLTSSQQRELKTQFSLNIAAGQSPVSAAFSATSAVIKSDTLRSSIDDKFAENMRAQFSKGGSLSYVATGTQGKQLINSLNDVITTGKSFQTAVSNVKTAQSNLSFAETHQGTVDQNALLKFMDNFDKEHGLTRDNINATAAANNAEYKKLLGNSAPLAAFVSGNPAFTGMQNKINVGAAGIPSVSPAGAKKGVTGLYNNNQPTYTPLAGTPTPSGVKAEIKIMDKSKKPLDTQHTVSNIKPENAALYTAGYVYNFVGTGLTDVVRLTQGKGPEAWNPSGYKPTITEATHLTAQAITTNKGIEAYNAKLAKLQGGINNSLLPGSAGAGGDLFNQYSSNQLVKAGNGVTQGNQNLGLRPTGASTPDDKGMPTP